MSFGFKTLAMRSNGYAKLSANNEIISWPGRTLASPLHLCQPFRRMSGQFHTHTHQEADHGSVQQ